ncbi:MAG TPA: hypothetical protein VE954_14465 [Oligoflexus sp.]|uniref:hypothetical protein n=1 Tax=Oligoflexus sp. TaxID=1971216 RepID=UPI002D6456EA|nr:hypothetical protein [Oligoflexus sp.]HYX34303.1 hypothetical protein [Oligoflexus sp.]
MISRRLVTALSVVILVSAACTPRDGVGPTIEGSALPAESQGSKPNDPLPSADPVVEVPISVEQKEPTEPVDITLTWQLDKSTITADCPAYQTVLPGKNSFILQIGEIGDIIAKGSRAPLCPAPSADP